PWLGLGTKRLFFPPACRFFRAHRRPRLGRLLARLGRLRFHRLALPTSGHGTIIVLLGCRPLTNYRRAGSRFDGVSRFDRLKMTETKRLFRTRRSRPYSGAGDRSFLCPWVLVTETC